MKAARVIGKESVTTGTTMEHAERAVTRVVAHSGPIESLSGVKSIPPMVMHTMNEAKRRPRGGDESGTSWPDTRSRWVEGATVKILGTQTKTKVNLGRANEKKRGGGGDGRTQGRRGAGGGEAQSPLRNDTGAERGGGLTWRPRTGTG